MTRPNPRKMKSWNPPIDVVKPWYQSRAVWGGIVAAVSGIAGAFGVVVDEPTLVEISMSVSAAVGGILAIYGRYKADRAIGRNQ